jgi:hypothetical protein
MSRTYHNKDLLNLHVYDLFFGYLSLYLRSYSFFCRELLNSWVFEQQWGKKALQKKIIYPKFVCQLDSWKSHSESDREAQRTF